MCISCLKSMNPKKTEAAVDPQKIACSVQNGASRAQPPLHWTISQKAATKPASRQKTSAAAFRARSFLLPPVVIEVESAPPATD